VTLGDFYKIVFVGLEALILALVVAPFYFVYLALDYLAGGSIEKLRKRWL
jgi:hypothetical protein